MIKPDDQFTRWTVVEYIGKGYWKTVCACGRPGEVKSNSLATGQSKSCGCLAREMLSTAKKRHGATNSIEYGIWIGIRTRCYNKTCPGYFRYGGRGITVCDRWSLFENFLADMGPRPSGQHKIERLDNDGPYSPENCKWATPTEQARNRSTNRILTLNGESRTLAEWAERLGVNQGLLRQRLNAYGWSVERALTEPPDLRKVGLKKRKKSHGAE